jgi:hypothetical protein
LADSSNRLQPFLSLTLILQFLTPNLSASLVAPSVLVRFGLPTRLLPSGLSKVIFLHGRLSCIRTICPAHLSLVILIHVTKSVSSYKRYSSSLYLDLHVALSQKAPVSIHTNSMLFTSEERYIFSPYKTSVIITVFCLKKINITL